MYGKRLIGIGWLALAMALAMALAGCNNKPHSAGNEAVPKDQTAPPVAATETQPAATPTVARTETQSAPEQPVPASLPASTYDSKPPYPVSIFVRSPEDEQPGWLKIMALANTESTASCTGRFPEQNRIEVQTSNVQQIRLHISHLPLAERKRIILRIDDQAIELARKNRDYVILERRSTGEWDITKSLP